MYELNDKQKEAVEYNGGPLLILAGAGSGKTRVIVYRIANLINVHKVNPSNILAVTFTNKAADEMKSRLTKLIEGNARELWVSTFHSACLRILRQGAERIGYPKDFVIYDDIDQLSLCKDCIKELNLDEKRFPPKALSSVIEGCKNRLVGPEEYAAEAKDFWGKGMAEGYRLYQSKLAENRAMDFGDLIHQTVRLLREHPQVLEYYQERFKYVLIDEYQDTNHAQYQLVKLLSGKYKNLCVVGDDDQSIYRWRGADLNNILKFEEDYPGALVVKLEQNYRSTQNILSAASSVIKHNEGRKEKTLWTENTSGEKISLYVAGDEKEEAKFVVDKIMEEVKGGERRATSDERRYSDFAIFYRTNAQSRQFEDLLQAGGVPYTIYGGTKFYERKEIKDVLAYLRLLVSTADGVSLKRIINVPTRGIGRKAMEEMEAVALNEKCSLYEAGGKVGGKAGAFYRMIEEARVKGQGSRVKGEGLASLVQYVMEESGYIEALERERTIESEGRLENLSEFVNVVSEYATSDTEATLAGFLDRISLASHTDNYDSEKGVLPLMTLHLAKGLEFDTVFMAGMEEGIFPHVRSQDDPEELEEERRLCYVGMTRARKKLYLIHSVKRWLYGSDQFNLPSRFLEEVPEKLIDVTGERGQSPSDWGTGHPPAPRLRWAGKKRDLSPDKFASDERRATSDESWDQRTEEERTGTAPPHPFDFAQGRPDPLPQGERGKMQGRGLSPLRIGSHVRHPSFGIGVIKGREGRDEAQKVTVYFKNGLVKRLAVKYADLELLK